MIATEKADAQYYLCRNLADLFVQSGHTCMISASRANGFRKASLYPSVPLKKPLFTEAGHSYEEWLYAAGAGSERWLSSDVDNLLETADATHPDLIISMDRIGAVIQKNPSVVLTVNKGQMRTDYRYFDPTFTFYNWNIDNTKARRISTFRWNLSNTK